MLRTAPGTERFQYPPSGEELTNVDRRGRKTRVRTNQDSDPLRVVDFPGNKTGLTYDAAGRITTLTDPDSLSLCTGGALYAARPRIVIPLLDEYFLAR